MKVAIYTLPFYPSIGGMERMAGELANGLAAIGNSVVLVTRTMQLDKNADVKFPFKVVRERGLFRLIWEMCRAEVVVFVGISLAPLIILTLLGKRILLTHHIEYNSPKSRRANLLGYLKRWIAKRYVNISVSRYIAERIGGRQLVIHNPYDNNIFYDVNSPRSPNSVVFCGRLIPEKGCDLALEAFSLLIRRVELSHFTFIGDGAELRILKEKAVKLGIGERIKFLGSLNAIDLAAVLRSSVCMVVPSMWAEPFGIVVLEGLASGCKMVVSRRGGIPEALGGHGQLVEPDAEALAEAMYRALVDRSSVWSDPRRDFLRRHTTEFITRRYNRVMRVLCENDKFPR